MRLKTHESTALALSYLLYARTSPRPHPLQLFYGAVASVLAQRLLDGVGHTTVCRRGRCYPARNRMHSLPAVAALGLLLSTPLLLAGVHPPYALAPLAALLLHYLEDMVTEGGVYLGEGRVKLVGLRYDDPVANAAASLAFTILLFAAPPGSPVAAAYWAASLAYLLASLR